jgi:hypothetical protein
MVEFVRDVIIAVAVLATVIAVAVHPGQEAESLGHGGTSVMGTRLPIALDPAAVSGSGAPAK